MVKISITSPGGKRRFACEFVLVEQAQKLLDVLRVHGYEAAEQYVQRIGENPCRVCGKPKSNHVTGGHKFIPLANR